MSGIEKNNSIYMENEIDSNVANEIEMFGVQVIENIHLVEEQNVEEENIGGGNTDVEEIAELTQMEKDAKSILENKSLTSPLKGTITSRFGTRESQNPIVPKNHTGIDIAVNEGTVFIAAMSGTVQEVSSER